MSAKSKKYRVLVDTEVHGSFNSLEEAKSYAAETRRDCCEPDTLICVTGTVNGVVMKWWF